MHVRSTNKLISLILLFNVISLVQAEERKAIVVTSKLSDVTVYADRAQVTRMLIKVFNKGTHTLLFDNLPANVDQNSIQVNGKGLVELLDVEFKKIYVKRISNGAVSRLRISQQKVEDKIQKINDSVEQAKAEKNFVIKITEKLTNTKQKEAKAVLDPQKWVKMVSFYRKKMSSLDKEMRELSKALRELGLELERIQEEIRQLGANSSKSKNQVQLKINIPATGQVRLKVSYVVHGPSWRPLYDLRVSSNSKTMAIVYKAMVRQSSGEDWTNVNLKLSTAKPNISGVRPSLRAWYLNIYKPDVKAPREQSKFKREAAKSAPIDEMRYQFNDKKRSAKGGRFANELLMAKPMKRKQAGVDSLSLNAVFVIKQTASIKADNNAHQVSIFNKTFKAKMRYSVIPKIAEHAYLKAQVTNNTVFPLLAGPANVFLDSNFVAHSRLKSVAPKEEFWTYLGVDNGVKVKYKFINKFQEKLGVFSKTTLNTYEYQITVKNNKGHSTAIHVWDQIPMARNESIKVKLIKPEINKKTKHVKVNKLKMIEWFYRPKAGQTITIPFKYSVEHPADKGLTSTKGK